MSNKRYDTSKQWYAIHTYSGYEEKVAESIRQRAESLDMKDKIFQALVPKEKQIEIKNGKRRVVEPGSRINNVCPASAFSVTCSCAANG